MSDEETRKYIFAFMLMRMNLTGWAKELEGIRDEMKAGDENDPDYVNGYVHGMNTAIAHLEHYIPEIRDREEWMREHNGKDSSGN